MTTPTENQADKPDQKRLIVCCDGTWMNSNEGTKRGDGSVLSSIMGLGGLTLQQPSNVTRICRCIKGSSEKLVTQDGEEVLEKIKQITYYQSGIGTSNTEDKVSGGLTGEGEAGLAEHIREAYQFLAANYSEESNDEIVLVGFSRGSFTARSIAAFINDIGLLTPAGLKYFYPIFEDWENQQQEGYQTSFPQYPFASPRPDMYTHADEYAQKLFDLGFTRPGIKVKAIAVYDTVGSLGVPPIHFWKEVSSPQHSLDFAFVDTVVPTCIENAIHALALDESRTPFSPTMWEKPTELQTLTQVWFAGSHADVGGGYDETGPANITLAWMVGQLSKFIEFDSSVLDFQLYPEVGEKRPWSCGVLNNEYTGLYDGTGFTSRTPGGYLRYDHTTGAPFVPAEPLEDTNEKIHASIRIRCGLQGHLPRTGTAPDAGIYTGSALTGKPGAKGWQIHGLPTPPPQTGKMSLNQIHEYQQKISWVKAGNTTVMEEDLIGEVEWALLNKLSPDIANNFFGYAPKPT